MRAGQKAEGWEKRGTVDAALQQQFANMQEYGSESNYGTQYGQYSNSHGADMHADDFSTDMYKASFGGNTGAAVPQLQADDEVYEVQPRLRYFTHTTLQSCRSYVWRTTLGMICMF
jgi:hypothetical protein